MGSSASASLKAEAQKDSSMLIQKKMIADHFEQLEAAPETKQPVVYTFVPGNLTELIRSFGALPLLPEINALQSGMRGKSRDYIAEAEPAKIMDMPAIRATMNRNCLRPMGSCRRSGPRTRM